MKPPYVHESRDGYQAFARTAQRVVWGAVKQSRQAALASLKKFQEIK